MEHDYRVLTSGQTWEIKKCRHCSHGNYMCYLSEWGGYSIIKLEGYKEKCDYVKEKTVNDYMIEVKKNPELLKKYKNKFNEYEYKYLQNQ